MEKEALKKSVNLNLRCVTQSCKGGVPLNRLEKDYNGLIGKPIPIKDLGYNSIESFLQSIPDVVRLKRSNDGQTIVEGVADASTAHIANLISKQKNSKTGKVTSKKPSVSIRKYSCHDSWRSSASTSSGTHKKDNKASNPQPAQLKTPVLNTSNSKLINSASSSKSLTEQQSLLDSSKNLTLIQQGTSQSSNSILASKEITIEPYEALVTIPKTATKSGLTNKKLSKQRAKMRKAAKNFINTSTLSLTDVQLEEKILKAQKLHMTTTKFLKWLKESSSNSITLTENQDPAKYTEQLQKQENQALRSRTLRNLWHVAFRFEEGILLAKLPNEYMTLFGTSIPCKELGYKTLKAFLQDIPDVIRLKRENGADWAEAVRDTNSLASGLASQRKEVQSTSTESINCAYQSGWETSSNSSSMSNTSKPLPLPTVKKCVEQSLESIQSVLSSYATITSIPHSPITKPKPVLPSSSKAAPCESVSSNELNLSKLGYKPTLNSFPKIKCSIASAEFNSLLLMNMLLYGDDSFMEILKRGVLAFDGFSFSEDSDEWKQRELLLSMLPIETLKECLKLLCIECDSNNKQVLVYKIMQFLSSPSKALSERKN